MKEEPNQVTAANAGGVLSFQIGDHWPGIAEFFRSAAKGALRNMRSRVFLSFALLVRVATYGQGTFFFDNRVPPDIDARFILSTDPPDGNYSSVGTDYIVSLFGGPAGTPVAALVPITPLPSSIGAAAATFRGAAGSVGAGYVWAATFGVPGVPEGTPADILVRVSSLSEACSFERIFMIPALGPNGGGGVTPPVLNLGTTPLVLECVPEVPASQLLLLGLLATYLLTKVSRASGLSGLVMKVKAEPADAPNPAIAPPFQVERQWRRVGDPGRSAL